MEGEFLSPAYTPYTRSVLKGRVCCFSFPSRLIMICIVFLECLDLCKLKASVVFVHTFECFVHLSIFFNSTICCTCMACLQQCALISKKRSCIFCSIETWCRQCLSVYCYLHPTHWWTKRNGSPSQKHKHGLLDICCAQILFAQSKESRSLPINGIGRVELILSVSTSSDPRDVPRWEGRVSTHLKAPD